MNQQNKLLASVQGSKSARLDNNTTRCRQAGWKDWANKVWSEDGLLYEKQEFKTIQTVFGYLFDNPTNHRSVSKEIRMILMQSNLLDTTSSTYILDAMSTNVASKRQKLDPVITPMKDTPTSTTTPTIGDVNDPWRWESIKTMGIKDLSVYELALQCKEAGSIVPNSLLESIDMMSPQKLASAKHLVRKAREDVLKHQLVQPRIGELLVDFLERVRHFNNDDDDNQTTSLKTMAYQQRSNGQLMLTDRAAHVLRHVHYCHKVPLSRLPAMVCAIAPYFLGQPLNEDEFPSTSTLRLRFTRLHLIDRFFLRQEFMSNTAVYDKYGNPILFFSTDDDSKHLNEKRHALLFSARSPSGNPQFKLGTTSAAIAPTADSNSTLNVESLKQVLGVDANGLRALSHYGGGTSDNASDAISTTKKTFERILEIIPTERRLLDGVRRQALVWGDPFHIWNLCVMWASLAAFGETERGKHQQVHHRQLLQSLYDAVKENKGIASVVENEIQRDFSLIQQPHVSVVRERQQRWMVNQRQSSNVLAWYNIDCEGNSFMLIFLARLASRVRSRSGWQADAAEHAGKLLAMPEIRTALYFEAEMGKYFNVVMAWHSRKGIISNRPGFRMMEVHEFFFRFELPFWKNALQSPEVYFPDSFCSLIHIEGEELRNKKREQLLAGIKAGYNEFLKMSKYYFSSQNIFLILLLGQEGPCFCRALARVLRETTIPLPTEVVVDQWDLPETSTELEKYFKKLLEVDSIGIIHWFQQHGLVKAITELKKLSSEEPSSRGLLEFKETYPIIYTTLHSTFGLMPSASRIAEQLHGMLRHYLSIDKASASHETTNQRQAYLLQQEYENRSERRKQVEERLDTRPKGGFKHEASKAEQQMIGEQVMRAMKQYEPENLSNKLSLEELASIKIRSLNEEGVRKKDDLRALAQNQLAIEKAARRKNPDKTSQDFINEGSYETVDNDNDWVDFEQQQINSRRKELSRKAFWSSQDKDTLSRVFKNVFPGIQDATKNTKGSYLDVIGAYLKEESAADRINLQAAVGLTDAPKNSNAARRTDAMLVLFTSSESHQDIEQHYIECATTISDKET